MNIKKEHWRAILKIKELFSTITLSKEGFMIRNEVVSISELAFNVEKDEILIVKNRETYSIISNPSCQYISFFNS